MLSPSRCLGLICLAATLSGCFADDEILLESFDNPIHTWKEMNDPVMGGRSNGSFHIDNTESVGVFQGSVKDVPFLHAPGFIQARTTDGHAYPDVSMCNAFKLTLRSHTDYTGYRFSFGRKHARGGKMHAFGFKITLVDIPKDEFADMILPFDEFTDFWDDATGDPIVTCHQDSAYCPTAKDLRNLKTMAIWGEGVKGKVSLEIKSISAVGCASSFSSSIKTKKKHLREPVVLHAWRHQQLLTTLLSDFLNFA